MSSTMLVTLAWAPTGSPAAARRLLDLLGLACWAVCLAVSTPAPATFLATPRRRRDRRLHLFTLSSNALVAFPRADRAGPVISFGVDPFPGHLHQLSPSSELQSVPRESVGRSSHGPSLFGHLPHLLPRTPVGRPLTRALGDGGSGHPPTRPGHGGHGRADCPLPQPMPPRPRRFLRGPAHRPVASRRWRRIRPSVGWFLRLLLRLRFVFRLGLRLSSVSAPGSSSASVLRLFFRLALWFLLGLALRLLLRLGLRRSLAAASPARPPPVCGRQLAETRWWHGRGSGHPSMPVWSAPTTASRP